jgi:hypothetical protein|tara:strand:+ start:189 stop:536 length:348 start_codon:yes stop_codon:yes gene_type:complete
MADNYKIILKNYNNEIANHIYLKIDKVRSIDKEWLVYKLKKFIYSHLKLPLYEKRDIEEIIFNYGIQNAIQHYILNKKKFEDIMDFIYSDENSIIYGIAFNIVYENFEYRIVDKE